MAFIKFKPNNTANNSLRTPRNWDNWSDFNWPSFIMEAMAISFMAGRVMSRIFQRTIWGAYQGLTLWVMLCYSTLCDYVFHHNAVIKTQIDTGWKWTESNDIITCKLKTTPHANRHGTRNWVGCPLKKKTCCVFLAKCWTGLINPE